MCGIIGYVGSREAKPLLLGGLKRLEYRGYDSAGIALREDDRLDYVRAVGNLQNLVDAAGPNGSISSQFSGTSSISVWRSSRGAWSTSSRHSRSASTSSKGSRRSSTRWTTS